MEEGTLNEDVEPTIEKADELEEEEIDNKSHTLPCAVPIEHSHSCCRPRVRSFPLNLPEALQERGLPEKRWRKIIKKVNRIWDPPVEICSDYWLNICFPLGQSMENCGRRGGAVCTMQECTPLTLPCPHQPRSAKASAKAVGVCFSVA